MPWVQYNSAGAICGLCANQQNTADEQFLADTDPSVVAYLTPQVTSVTPRQARMALAQAGLLDQVNTIVQAAGSEAEIWWDYASSIDITHPMITAVSAALSPPLTQAQVQALFNTANTL